MKRNCRPAQDPTRFKFGFTPYDYNKQNAQLGKLEEQEKGQTVVSIVNHPAFNRDRKKG